MRLRSYAVTRLHSILIVCVKKEGKKNKELFIVVRHVVECERLSRVEFERLFKHKIEPVNFVKKNRQ